MSSTVIWPHEHRTRCDFRKQNEAQAYHYPCSVHSLWIRACIWSDRFRTADSPGPRFTGAATCPHHARREQAVSLRGPEPVAPREPGAGRATVGAWLRGRCPWQTPALSPSPADAPPRLTLRRRKCGVAAATAALPLQQRHRRCKCGVALPSSAPPSKGRRPRAPRR